MPELERALELDPRNVYRLQQIAGSHWILRRYAEAAAFFNRALAIDPNNVQAKTLRADLDLAWKANTRAVHEVIESLRENNPGALHDIADSWLFCALGERDVAWAKAALIAAGENTPINSNAIHFNRSFAEGMIAHLENDESKARAAFIGRTGEDRAS